MAEERRFLPGTQIELQRDAPRAALRHALFDFDGAISILGAGWPKIMAPLMTEMITGSTQPDPEVEAQVAGYIGESTGIQTILQMERLVEMVREGGHVAEDQILEAHEYKAIYNDRLMKMVNRRIAKLSSGEMKPEEATLRGALDFVRALHEAGLTLHIFSGTDRDDVRNEARLLGAAPYFGGRIWGALGSYAAYSKEKVLRELFESQGLEGPEVLVVGDGPVEIRNAKAFGCLAVGVASDEDRGRGWNLDKRQRLIAAGADLLVPDFSEGPRLVEHLLHADG
jgi:phosphoglycolate phosphatase-like HAD superfamily hydrolase